MAHIKLLTFVFYLIAIFQSCIINNNPSIYKNYSHFSDVKLRFKKLKATVTYAQDDLVISYPNRDTFERVEVLTIITQD